MKKMLAMFILAMLTMQVAIAGDVVTKDVNKLPASARETIKKHFPQTKISYIKIDKDLFKSTTYEATLTNGVEIDFDSGKIYDRTKGTEFQGQPFPEFMQKLIAAGGLVKYTNSKRK